MSFLSDKYLIGLTGNIATGKSVIRKMLEHLGAYGIDADRIAHRMMYTNGDGYTQVVDTFGVDILDKEKRIDRAALGRIVFNDPDALAELERILHPLVRQAVGSLVNQVPFSVVVLEAIRLLESSLAEKCSSIWVSNASVNHQVKRLVNSRSMEKDEAIKRIYSQPPQSDKIKAADVIIENESAYLNTWEQVKTAWINIFKDAGIHPPRQEYNFGQTQIFRSTPDDVEYVTNFLNKFGRPEYQFDQPDVIQQFTEIAYLVLKSEEQETGVLGWNLSNFTSIIDPLYIDPARQSPAFLGTIVNDLEGFISLYKTELNVINLAEVDGSNAVILKELGYTETNPHSIRAAGWQDILKQEVFLQPSIWIKWFG